MTMTQYFIKHWKDYKYTIHYNCKWHNAIC